MPRLLMTGTTIFHVALIKKQLKAMHQKGKSRIVRSGVKPSASCAGLFWFSTDWTRGGSLTKQHAVIVAKRNTPASVMKVCGTPSLFSSVCATGPNSTVDKPKADTLSPDAKPLLSGNHFCRQLNTQP